MTYGYARVSTKTQAREGNSLESQRARLKGAGAEVIYSDSFTGKEIARPEFDKLRKELKEGDTLIVCKLDRLARSAVRGSQLIEELIGRGVSVHVLNMGIMDNTPTGKLIRNIMLGFAEFERDMIVERTSEGKAVAREKGVRVDGRPQKEVEDSVFQKFSKKQKEGLLTVKECCKELGISRSKWYSLARGGM